MTTSQPLHLVVAGGSSGIGLAVAHAARHLGTQVTVLGRDPARLAAAGTAVPGLRTVVADVLDPESLRAAFASGDSVDQLVVTAGTAVLSDFLDGGPAAAQLAGGFSTKVVGAANVVQAAHPQLTAEASVVLTGGLSTERPVRGAWSTSVGTAAVEQLARVLAVELAPVRVNAVSPGWTTTPMWDAVLGDQAADVLRGAAQGQLTGAVATPEEVAAAVLALLTNSAITAAVLHVDGGARLT